jgi:hypothetical protein
MTALFQPVERPFGGSATGIFLGATVATTSLGMAYRLKNRSREVTGWVLAGFIGNCLMRIDPIGQSLSIPVFHLTCSS